MCFHRQTLMLKTKEARSMIKKQEKKKQSLAKARRTQRKIRTQTNTNKVQMLKAEARS